VTDTVNISAGLVEASIRGLDAVVNQSGGVLKIPVGKSVGFGDPAPITSYTATGGVVDFVLTGTPTVPFSTVAPGIPGEPGGPPATNGYIYAKTRSMTGGSSVEVELDPFSPTPFLSGTVYHQVLVGRDSFVGPALGAIPVLNSFFVTATLACDSQVGC